MFVDELIDENPKLRFQPHNPKRRLIELHFLLKLGVRRMIRSQDRQCAIGDALDDRIDIRFRPQRRIHFVIGVEILDRFVGQRDVMRANLAADLHSSRTRFADQTHTSSRADVLTVNVMIAKFGQQNISHYDRFFAGGRPAGQTEKSTPVAFVDHAVPDQTVILAMIEHGQSNHARVFDCAPHQFVILDAMAVVGDRNHAGLT